MQKYIKKLLFNLLINKDKFGLIISGPAKGYKILNPKLSHLLGRYEPKLIKAIKKYVNNREVVFDIGANIGYITLVLSNIVGIKGNVYSFEPVPETFNKLELNIAINQLKNVNLSNLGVSDKKGSVIFRMIKGHDSMASMNWHKNVEDALMYKVDCISIDTEQHYSKLTPSFIKIDVEGAEAEVIRGMHKLIERVRPIIYTEVSELGREYVWNTLISLNYYCYSSLDEKKIENIEQYKHDDFIWKPY